MYLFYHNSLPTRASHSLRICHKRRFYLPSTPPPNLGVHFSHFVWFSIPPLSVRATFSFHSHILAVLSCHTCYNLHDSPLVSGALSLHHCLCSIVHRSSSSRKPSLSSISCCSFTKSSSAINFKCYYFPYIPS